MRLRMTILILIMLSLMISFCRCIFLEKFDERMAKETKAAHCLMKTMEEAFIAQFNLHLIMNNQENHQDFIRLLYTRYSFLMSNQIIQDNSTRRFVIIEDDHQSLRKRFDESSLSKWFEYIILTKSPYSDVASIANSLYKKEFYFLAFVLISEEDVNIIQFRRRAQNYNDILSTIRCDEEFLNNGRQNSIRRFNKFVCPPNGCTLSYWKLVSEAPNNLTYIVHKNGTVSAYSIGADMLEEFADMYHIHIKKDLNHSIIDTSWQEGVKAILNDSIDVLFGFSIPNTKSVESLMISTWNQ